MSTELVAYAEHHEQAFTAFTRIDILEHPAPKAPKWYEGLPFLMLPFGVIALAGIALSALRTAPVFQQIALPMVGKELSFVEAVLAVVVIEFFIVVARYVHIVIKASEGNIPDIGTWISNGFWLAFGVAVLANLYASVRHLPLLEAILPLLDLVMALLVGFSAPALAFISGDILGVLWARSERYRREMREQFESRMEDWKAARERRWNSQKSKYGVTSISIPAPSNGIPLERPLETERVVLPSASTLGHTKKPQASQIVRDYLKETPDALDMNPLDLAARLNVGKSTVYNVLSEVKKS